MFMNCSGQFMKTQRTIDIKFAIYWKRRRVISRKAAKPQSILGVFAPLRENNLCNFHCSQALRFVQFHPKLSKHKIVHPVFNQISVAIIGKENSEVKNGLY